MGEKRVHSGHPLFIENRVDSVFSATGKTVNGSMDVSGGHEEVLRAAAWGEVRSLRELLKMEHLQMLEDRGRGSGWWFQRCENFHKNTWGR